MTASEGKPEFTTESTIEMINEKVDRVFSQLYNKSDPKTLDRWKCMAVKHILNHKSFKPKTPHLSPL